MTIEEIRELIAVVNDSGIAELEVQRGENRVRIRRTQREFRTAYTAVDAQPGVAVQAAHAPAAAPVPTAAAEDQTLVKSPIVGTFYESSSPGSPPFVKVGDPVQPGAVLCIIESMKL